MFFLKYPLHNFKNKSSTKKEESKKVLEALYLQENELEEKLKK